MQIASAQARIRDPRLSKLWFPSGSFCCTERYDKRKQVPWLNHSAVLAVDRVGAKENQIEFTEASKDNLVRQNLEIATPTGCSKLNETRFRLRAGSGCSLLGNPALARRFYSRQSQVYGGGGRAG